jgi:phage-related protein
MDGDLKPVRWVGSSLQDLRSVPLEVRREIGHALSAAQKGETDPAAKPLKGFSGANVMEIVAPFDRDTWRAVYTSAFGAPFTFSTPSRKSLRPVSPHRRKRLT